MTQYLDHMYNNEILFPQTPTLINLNWNNSDKCAKSSKEEAFIN